MRHDLYQFPKATNAQGRNLYLLGLSIDGPVNTPIPISSLEDAEAIFGSADFGDLVRAYTHAALTPDVMIFLVRITGEYARATITGTVDEEPIDALQIRSVAAGDVYNDIRIYIDTVPRAGIQEAALIFEIPIGAMESRAYILSDYETIDELVRQINRDTYGKKNLVHASSQNLTASPDCLLSLDEPVSLSGGHNGLTVADGPIDIPLPKDDLYIALDTAYGLLSGQEIDVICPVSARFDDSHPSYFYGSTEYGNAFYTSNDDYLGLLDTQNEDRMVTFHGQLINFCIGQIKNGFMTHGVLGMREIKDLTDLTKHSYSYVAAVAQATAMRDRYDLLMYENGQWSDQGYHITIFAHDFVYNAETVYEHFANGAPLYASMVASMGTNETLTNKALPETVTLRYELADDELPDLSRLGITAARNSIKRGPVIAAAVTASMYDSQMHSIANVRMVQETIEAVNTSVDDMIGEAFTPIITQRELERRINEVLSQLVTRNVLRNYRVSIDYNKAENRGYISLELLTKYAVEYISTSTSITFSGRRGVVGT